MSAETSGATARPWKAGKHFPEFVYGANKKDGFIVDCGPDDRNAANAALIVRAVNEYDAHKALEDAARETLKMLDFVADEYNLPDEREALRTALAEIDYCREGGEG